MTLDQKRSAALQLLRSRGLLKTDNVPPLLKLLWGLGLNVPPPQFASFFGLFVFSSLALALPWGALMWLLKWNASHMSIGEILFRSIGFGCCVGLFFTLMVRYSARKNSIPHWSQFKSGVGK